MKLLVLAVLTLSFLYRLALNIVQYRSCGNPIPENVADVYDPETYEKWRRYGAENCRLSVISTVISYAASMVLLCANVYAAVAAVFPRGEFWQILAVIGLDAVVNTLVDVGIRYYRTMVVEEKYGFNRSTMKTFIVDQLRSLLMEIGLSYALAKLLAVVHGAWGDGMILVFALALLGFSLAMSFLYPIFSRLGNKFVPLEEGELRTSLEALLTKHGYRVKAIEVMDASRRTTKLNAYFTGFGRLKTIVLYDNLINAMTPEEICAVFAHELGHGLHKDVLKMQIMNFGNLLMMAVIAWLAVRDPQLCAAFGFAEMNYGFGFLLAGFGLGLIQPLSGMLMNAYSRFAEFRADRQAVREGYGDAMILALKKLARENFAHLAPSRVNVVLEYSHPPLSQRLESIVREMRKP